MKRQTKILLGILTVWPIIFIIIFAGFCISSNKYFLSIIPIVLVVYFISMMAFYGVMIYFIVDAFRNTKVKKDQKLLWAVVIFLGNMLVMPIYWYLFIWREQPESNQLPLAGTSFNFCPVCGTRLSEYAYCMNCGRPLSDFTAVPPMNQEPELLLKVIPYKNINALIGYYFGVFSLIPLFPIGIVGFILGLKGLAYAKSHPEAYGTVHAWVGIVAGGLFGFGYMILTGVGIYYGYWLK